MDIVPGTGALFVIFFKLMIVGLNTCSYHSPTYYSGGARLWETIKMFHF
ncbi:hypothetical protein [Bacillus changyiensis]|nr:hypothetical protein [Bacillus changyiensis]MDA1475029.1 hypothetical protein [Bacillus changyiensis]